MCSSIRRCDAADVHSWAQMRHSLWPDSSTEEHVAEILSAMQDSALRGYLASGSAGRDVGFAEVSIRRYANGCTGSPVPFLEGIWIVPEYRQHGIAGLLIDRISADCVAEGFIELCSDAEVNNLMSHHAHQRWGFAETERVVYFRKPL